MPKPILHIVQKQDIQLDLNNQPTINAKLDLMTLDRRLRQKRSLEYMNALKQLDVGGHNLNKSQFDAFIEAVKQEFQDVQLEDSLVGIVSKCYLGEPYDVHTLDIAGNIVTHFKVSEGMPPLLERARGMALYGRYEFIEVYVDSLRAITTDGTVSVVK